jgi:hypothetical protein
MFHEESDELRRYRSYGLDLVWFGFPLGVCVKTSVVPPGLDRIFHSPQR